MAFISLLNNVCILYSANSLHWPILYQSRFFSGNSFIITIFLIKKVGLHKRKDPKITKRDFKTSVSNYTNIVSYM